MSKFQEIEFYKKNSKEYHLLPFRFINLSDEKLALTNLVGEYHLTDRKVLDDLVHHRLDRENSEYSNLRSKHFLYDEQTIVAKDLLKIKYRTKFFLLSLRSNFNLSDCWNTI